MLENSNVSPMHEMVRLMEAMRHAESMQKVAIGYDEMLATSIRRLGEGT
jgi:flagellar basal-body rod protein FlgG